MEFILVLYYQFGKPAGPFATIWVQIGISWRLIMNAFHMMGLRLLCTITDHVVVADGEYVCRDVVMHISFKMWFLFFFTHGKCMCGDPHTKCDLVFTTVIHILMWPVFFFGIAPVIPPQKVLSRRTSSDVLLHEIQCIDSSVNLKGETKPGFPREVRQNEINTNERCIAWPSTMWFVPVKCRGLVEYSMT